MNVTKENFGITKAGEPASLFTLKNNNGVVAKLSDFGAALVELWIPDKNGQAADVVLGFDSAEDYSVNASFFGVTVGPNANRVGCAAFTLNETEYRLSANDGPNNLHSDAEKGWQKRLWAANTGENSVTFSLTERDGETGFPGNKTVRLTYTLTDDNALKLAYHASSDAPTLLNPTNHSYFNLAGHKAGSIEGHLLKLYASHFTPVLPGAIPTGEISPVAGTPLDFTAVKPIGADINADCEQLKLVQGYDHNFAIDGEAGALRPVAEVEEPVTGRRMQVFTTLPGVQFYAGNCIIKQPGKDGAAYFPRAGFCLETQYFPDSVHHPNFPQAIFGPGRDYASETIYRFL